MALIPHILHEVFDDYRRPVHDYRRPVHDIYDQHFGLGLLGNELSPPIRSMIAPIAPMITPMRSRYLRPWRTLAANESGHSRITSNKNQFQVNLDVQQFKPAELKVKVEGDFIIVEGNHEERSDEHGFISRQFTRKYKVPNDVDINALASNLSVDGVLSLKAPKKVSADDKAREIPIQHISAPAVKPSNDKKTYKIQE